MKQKKIPFYRKDPLLRTVGWAGYGLAPWLAPAVVPASMMDGTVAVATSAVLYGTMATAYAFPRTRNLVVELYRDHWLRFKHHLGARRVSKAIQETLFNAVVEIVEITDRKGRIRRKEIVHYPEVDIQVDESNVYIRFWMLAGQTEKEWERKIDAFSHALGCDLVTSKIERGMVQITLQYGDLFAPAATYKENEEHKVSIGYGTGGRVEWNFDQFPHALIVGPTGTGKSTFMRNLLIQLPKAGRLRSQMERWSSLFT